MRFIRTAALWIEAGICYGMPALLLFAGLPMLGIGMMSAQYGEGSSVDTLWILLLFACGLLGLFGALSLTRRAIWPAKRMAYPRVTLALVCLGVFALAGGLKSYDLNMAPLLGSLAASMHFLYLARSEFAPRAASDLLRSSDSPLIPLQARRAVAVSELIAPAAVIVIALGTATYERSSARDPQAAAAYAKTQEPDPCMRWFRDGSTPKVTFRLRIREPDWPQLAATLHAFALAHKLEFHDGSARFPDSGSVLRLSSCNDSGVVIESSTQIWRLGPEWEREPDRGVQVFIYVARAEADWRSLAEPLGAALKSAWPGAVVREDASAVSSR